MRWTCCMASRRIPCALTMRAAMLGVAILAATGPAWAVGRHSGRFLSANALFGAVSRPTFERTPEVVGSYAKGCIRGAVPLPTDGPAWQVMRLSRNRNWGHPALVSFVERFATAAKRDGWPGLLVG